MMGCGGVGGCHGKGQGGMALDAPVQPAGSCPKTKKPTAAICILAARQNQ